jgi:hypothetical protein
MLLAILAMLLIEDQSVVILHFPLDFWKDLLRKL